MPERKYAIPDLSLKIIDAGRIQLLDVLGAGAYGTIYRAVDRTHFSATPSFLAVKILPLADRNSRRGVYQAREIGYHNYVSGHPNILKLHRVVRDHEYLYIVLDYCPGGDMFRIVSRTRRFARNDALIKSMFLQLVDAVDACHQNGIFHRDLKPENILVSFDLSRLFLGDFGLATRTVRSSNFGAGSCYYMSPECVNADGVYDSYDPRRGDIWALGIILTNMVTGRCPWRRAALDDGCFRQYSRDRTFLRRMLPISKSLDVVLRRIFTLPPDQCIDLVSLRQLVANVDTFYMSEDELSTASEHVKQAWSSYEPPHIKDIEGRTLVDDETDSIMESASEDYTDSLADDSDDSNEHSFGVGTQSLLNIEEGSPTRDRVAASLPEDLHGAQVQDVFTLGSVEETTPSGSDSDRPPQRLDSRPSSPSHSYYDTDTDSSSDEDSDGPITPETHAQDPDVAVPNFTDGAGLGSSDVVQPITLPTSKKPQSHTGATFLRSLFGTRSIMTTA